MRYSVFFSRLSIHIMRKLYLFWLIFGSTQLFSQNLSDSLALEFLKKSKEYQSSSQDSALFFAREAYTLTDISDSVKLVAITQLATSLVENQKLEEAESIIDEALFLCEQQGNKKLLSKNYNTYGNYYFYSQKPDRALEMYRRSLEIDERSGDRLEYAKSLANFGIILNRMGREVDAKNSYLEALEIFRREGDKGSELRILVNLSSIYGMEDRPFFSLDSAILTGRQAIEVAKALNFPFGIAKASGVVCSPLIRKGYEDPAFLEEGLETARNARKFFENTKYKVDFEFALLNEGYALEALNRESEAIDIANWLLAENFSEKHECYRLLYRSYKRSGQFATALRYHEIYQSQIDSIHHLNLKQELNEIQTKYETVKKDNEIAQLNQEAAIKDLQIQQQNLITGALGISIFILIMGGFIFYRQNKLKQQQKVSDLEQRFLRFQMNPHFIFNALASIQNFILNQDPKEAVTYLAKFSKLMRQILEHSRQEFIPLQEEINMLKNYMDVQKVRFNGNFDYQIEIDEGLDPEYIHIPPMFAQPFIENSLEHGLKDKTSGGMIEVKFRKSGNVITIEVIDNGTGLPVEVSVKPKAHRSLATIITNERLALLGKNMKEKLSVMVQNAIDDHGNINGTKVALTVPYRKN